MIQADKSYVHGTAARKIEYNVYENNEVLKAKKKQRSYKKVKAKAVMWVLLLAAFGLVVIYRYAMITELNYNINKANKQYQELQNENIRLEAEIVKKLDLQKIREAAETRLGMQKPDEAQYVYVNVPKTDFTKLAEGNPAQNNETGISGLFDKISRFASFLY